MWQNKITHVSCDMKREILASVSNHNFSISSISGIQSAYVLCDLSSNPVTKKKLCQICYI